MVDARALAGPLAALTLVLGLVSCGGDVTAKPPRSDLERLARRAPVSPSPATVIAEDDLFVPEALKVRRGAPVTFRNDGRRIHNVIPTGGGDFRIDTDDLRPGMASTVVMAEPGTYPYFCSIHGTAARGMRGIIEVVR